MRLLHLPQRDSDTLHGTLKLRLGNLPGGLRRSITWDQGTEMARHLTITESLDAPIYFCDSRSPWQRGSNENTNGLLRDYFPKGTDLTVHTSEHLCAVENELNNRPRQVLDDDVDPAVQTDGSAAWLTRQLRRHVGESVGHLVGKLIGVPHVRARGKPDPRLQAFGARLRGLRERRDLTIEQLADVAGVSVRQITRVEVGRRARASCG